MKWIKELSEIEYSTKEMLAYFLVANKNAKNNYTEQNLTYYLRELMLGLKNINRNEILEHIDINLLLYFPFSHILDCDEVMSYGVIVFYTLLKSNQNITEQDIISQLEVEMRLYSSRNVVKEAEKILKKIKDEVKGAN